MMSSSQKTFLPDRTKDQSMNTAIEKDRTIESLREKCQEFSRLVSCHQDVHVQIGDVSTEKLMCQKIIFIDDPHFIEKVS